MSYNPIHEGMFKTNVAPGLFALGVFMPQDLVAFGQKLFVKPYFRSLAHS